MTILRIYLTLAWLGVIGFAIYATWQLGLDGAAVFFTDFTHPWRGQFNFDFTVHVILLASWVLYREPDRVTGVLCGLGVFLLGGAFFLGYLLVTTFRVRGDMRLLLLGRHA